MANRWYEKGAAHIAAGDTAWLTHDFKVILVDLADYTPNFTTDEFLSDIAGAAVVKTSGNLGTKAILAGGVWDAADVTLATVSGDQSEALIIYRDSGSPASSPLLIYIDDAQGLPVTPSGTNITIQWASDGIAAV